MEHLLRCYLDSQPKSLTTLKVQALVSCASSSFEKILDEDKQRIAASISSSNHISMATTEYSRQICLAHLVDSLSASKAIRSRRLASSKKFHKETSQKLSLEAKAHKITSKNYSSEIKAHASSKKEL